MVAPVLEELASDFEGKIDVYKVDTEEEQELASAFGSGVYLHFYLFRLKDNLKWLWEHCQKIPLLKHLKMCLV